MDLKSSEGGRSESWKGQRAQAGREGLFACRIPCRRVGLEFKKRHSAGISLQHIHFGISFL